MFSVAFMRDMLERAIATGAQVALSAFVLGETGLLDLDVNHVLSLAAGAMVASALKSLAATRRGDPESASLLLTK